jgi:hypothetical protein
LKLLPQVPRTVPLAFTSVAQSWRGKHASQGCRMAGGSYRLKRSTQRSARSFPLMSAVQAGRTLALISDESRRSTRSPSALRTHWSGSASRKPMGQRARTSLSISADERGATSGAASTGRCEEPRGEKETKLGDIFDANRRE